MSDKVHVEADELAQECVSAWLAAAGADLARLNEHGFGDPGPYISEALAAAMTGRDPDWASIGRAEEPPEMAELAEG